MRNKRRMRLKREAVNNKIRVSARKTTVTTEARQRTPSRRLHRKGIASSHLVSLRETRRPLLLLHRELNRRPLIKRDFPRFKGGSATNSAVSAVTFEDGSHKVRLARLSRNPRYMEISPTRDFIWHPLKKEFYVRARDNLTLDNYEV